MSAFVFFTFLAEFIGCDKLFMRKSGCKDMKIMNIAKIFQAFLQKGAKYLNEIPQPSWQKDKTIDKQTNSLF